MTGTIFILLFIHLVSPRSSNVDCQLENVFSVKFFPTISSFTSKHAVFFKAQQSFKYSVSAGHISLKNIANYITISQVISNCEEAMSNMV